MDDTVDDALGFAMAFHAPCRDAAPPDRVDGDVAVCVVADVDDPVVPPSARVPSVAGRYELIKVAGTLHGDLTKLAACPDPDAI